MPSNTICAFWDVPFTVLLSPAYLYVTAYSAPSSEASPSGRALPVPSSYFFRVRRTVTGWFLTFTVTSPPAGTSASYGPPSSSVYPDGASSSLTQYVPAARSSISPSPDLFVVILPASVSQPRSS